MYSRGSLRTRASLRFALRYLISPRRGWGSRDSYASAPSWKGLRLPCGVGLGPGCEPVWFGYRLRLPGALGSGPGCEPVWFGYRLRLPGAWVLGPGCEPVWFGYRLRLPRSVGLGPGCEPVWFGYRLRLPCGVVTNRLACNGSVDRCLLVSNRLVPKLEGDVRAGRGIRGSSKDDQAGTAVCSRPYSHAAPNAVCRDRQR